MSLDSDPSAEVPPWQNAVTLMQPTFIRVMDHLRHALEESAWKGQYETTHAWPQETTPDAKAQVLWLYEKLEGATPADQADIECQLEALPQPIPVYLLHLEKGQERRTLNLWELCYQICLASYTPHLERTDFVEIALAEALPDPTLLEESGEVDWIQLDQKAARLVQAAFKSLEVPSA